MSSLDSAKTASTATFLTALVLNAAVFAIEILAFTILRARFQSVYEPRSLLPDEDRRADPFTKWAVLWPYAIFKANYKDIRLRNGLDAYFFVRFLRFMVKILLPIWLLSWAVLLPIDAISPTAGGEGLERFTYGNVSLTTQNRRVAHLVLLYVFTIWILWNIKQELSHFVRVRHRHLIDPLHAATQQANTILITGVPRKYLDERELEKMFSYLPGGVRKIWLNRDLKDLPDIYDARLSACQKLESGETSLISTATKLHNKQLKKGGDTPVDGNADMEKDLTLAERLVPRAERPTHRLPLGFLPFSLPLVGQKVDTIDWCKAEIQRTDVLLREGREKLDQDARKAGPGNEEYYPPLNSAFILFNQQIAAHLAANSLLHHEPYKMTGRYTEVAPADVIWSNLSMNPYESKIRLTISYALTAALIIFWAIPVAFVGFVSNVPALCVKYHWLAWICKLPKPVVGIITGILPPVLLAVLMILLPIILRLLARFEGIPRYTGLELSLMSRFFLFQIVHGFLIVTISSGIIKALPEFAQNPAGIPNVLATNLPAASNFFITYILLQGLAGTASGFLNIGRLVVYYAKLYLLSSTPRSMYNTMFVLPSVAWGTLFPSITLLTVITITYSIISPLINGLACVAFFLFYQVWKYLFLWQLDQPAAGDTGGLFFPKAMTHTFVGLYIQQVCMAGLFFLAQDANKKPSCIVEGALTIVLIFLTFGYHMILLDSYNPLKRALPLSLANKSYGVAQDGRLSSTPSEIDAVPEDRYSSKRPLAKQSIDGRPAHGVEEHPMGRVGKKDFVEDGKGPSDGGPEMNAEVDLTRDRVDADGRVGAAGQDDTYKQKEVPADFNHPALQEQQIVWFPRDTLGVADAEMAELSKSQIKAATTNAEMDDKGKITIKGHPPGKKLRTL